MLKMRFSKYILLTSLILAITLNGFIYGQSSEIEDNIDKNKQWIQLAKNSLESIPDSSIYYISKVLENAPSKKHKIQAYSILGDAYQYNQKFDKAIENYLYSIELGENDSIPGILANAYNGIGMTYFALNEIDKAEDYINKAANEKLEINDYLYYAVIRSNLAVIYNRKGAYDKSNDILLSTEKVLTNNGKSSYLPNIYLSIGANFESNQKQLDSAAYYYQKAVKVGEKNKEYEVVKTSYYNLSDIAVNLKNYDNALNYLNTAKNIETERKIGKLDIAILNKFSEVYKELKDYKLAYEYKKQAAELNEELFGVEKQKQIKELEVKYETARKQKEIEKQKYALQQSEIEKEQAKNRLYIIVFGSILIIIVTVGIAIYFWYRKRSSQQLEIEKAKIFENIVHDIRTPLTLIAGPLEMVKSEMSSNKELMSHVNLVERNTDKLVKLVHELLDASKLEKGKFTPEYTEGNITSFLQNIVETYKSDADEKNIHLIARFDNTHKNRRFPSNVIEKITNNLLSNSLKYCPENSEVTISTTFENNILLLKVKDNGPGIPKKDQNKVFNRFYRVDEKNKQGTGIGLSIVKDLVDLIGGNVKLISEENNGTEFICTIPLKPSKYDVKNSSNEITLPKLLIVDDDTDIIRFVSSIFENTFEIIAAQNGAEGVELAKEHVPDIILSDVMMPIKDGLVLLEEVKTEDVTKHIPVVVFSSKASLESRLKGLEFGANAYIPKPFSPEELKLTLTNILTTIKHNQKEFQKQVNSNKPFDQRLKSNNEFVNKATKFVVDNIDDSAYTINELANDLCISRSQLHRKISSLTGFSSTNFIKMIRLEKAKDMLESSSGNVTEIAYSCGFNSQSYFTKSFKEYFGKSPSSFIER